MSRVVDVAMEFCGILRRPASQVEAGQSSDELDGVFLGLRRRRILGGSALVRSMISCRSRFETRGADGEMLSSHAVKCRVQSCVIERGGAVGQPTRGLLLLQCTVV